MYITTHTLIKHLHEHAERDDILDALQVIDVLYRRYGNRLRISMIQEKMTNTHPTIEQVLQLLIQYDQLGKEQTLIQGIHKLSKKDSVPMSIYSQNLNAKNTELLNNAIKEKAEKIEKQIYNKRGVRLEKNGKYYERNIQKDIKKLLR